LFIGRRLFHKKAVKLSESIFICNR